MKILFILNDPPYGSERSYNGLRLAGSTSKTEGTEVIVFMMGDAVSCAKSGQKVPQGYYNVEIMIKNVLSHKSKVGVCGTCIDARGITEKELIEGVEKSTLSHLTDWTMEVDKILVF